MISFLEPGRGRVKQWIGLLGCFPSIQPAAPMSQEPSAFDHHLHYQTLWSYEDSESRNIAFSSFKDFSIIFVMSTGMFSLSSRLAFIPIPSTECCLSHLLIDRERPVQLMYGSMASCSTHDLRSL